MPMAIMTASIMGMLRAKITQDASRCQSTSRRLDGNQTAPVNPARSQADYVPLLAYEFEREARQTL
jgi:hypothetical protein